MNFFRSTLLFAVLAAIFLAKPLSTQAGTKPVMVHYMPWFQGPYSLGSENWGYHWTYDNANYNPNTINSTNGEREIASWYYPLIGPYDSDDPTVLEYHTLLMKLGGIDGVIVDWYGPDPCEDYSINETRTLAVLAATERAGLKFSLCYEDATVKTEVAIDCDGFTAANAVAHAQGTMLYAQSNYFASPNYFRWGTNNEPVLLNFGPQYFTTNSGWVSIFSVLNATNQPAFFTEDNHLPVGTGAFDWPPMSRSVNGVLSESTLESYLASFQSSGASWTGFVSSAFPRYHDIYAQVGQTSNGYLTDTNGGFLGGTLEETLGRALTNNSAIIQLVTWNDFGEGTIIEPTANFGYLDLGIVQNFRRQYLDPTFSYTTNDLPLALRLYNQRQIYKTSNATMTGELNRVFTNLISGNLTTAGSQLTGVESKSPIIYNLSSTNGQLEFLIGGYISGSGVNVQSSTNAAAAVWQTVTTLPASANLLTYTTSIQSQAVPIFYKLQNAGP